MTQHRDYSHRDVLDKLGVKPGMRVAIDERAGALDSDLAQRVTARVGQSFGPDEAPVDLVLMTADADTDVTACLKAWHGKLEPSGGIWVLTPKRGLPGYRAQDRLIPDGLAAGLVDNKICSVSETTSAMRFVIRRADRPR
jgi:hypothetical protein